MTLSVLVIDDDESIRDTLVEFFETLGYSARGAATATEGRRLAQEHAADVILLDLRLPDADGLLTLQALRADDPDVAVISVGAGNKYGHPSGDVLRALARVGAEVLRTDEAGTVVVRTDGRRIEIEAGGDRWQVAHDSSKP